MSEVIDGRFTKKAYTVRLSGIAREAADRARLRLGLSLSDYVARALLHQAHRDDVEEMVREQVREQLG